MMLLQTSGFSTSRPFEAPGMSASSQLGAYGQQIRPGMKWRGKWRHAAMFPVKRMVRRRCFYCRVRTK